MNTSKEFKTYYMSLPRTDRNHVILRNNVVSECKISTTIFYNWLKGLTPVPHWAKPIIAKVFGVPVSELFPN